MPKTQNAYAFRTFDAEKILQRPFFKEFHFDITKTDAQILESLKAADSDSIDDMERKLNTVKATHGRLEKFRQLINRHYQKRCDRYNKRKATALGVKVSEIFTKRHAPTSEYFMAELDCIELADQFGKLYFELEKQIQGRYRKEFAKRLKQARKAAGLTQKQLGDMIQTSPNGYSQYETCKREPSISTLFRLLRFFSSEQLFGRQ